MLKDLFLFSIRNELIRVHIKTVEFSTIKRHGQSYIILAARSAFGGPLANQGATPPGPPFDSIPVSWMKSAYYNKVDICLCTNTKILSLVQ